MPITKMETPSSSARNPLLDQNGDNLVLINRELFLESERLRTQIQASSKVSRRSFESGSMLRREPTTFQSFSRLPQELQNLIWKTAAWNEQRVVEFYTSVTKKGGKLLLSKTGAPNMIFACRASRSIGLLEYARLESKCHDSTYIAWERDVVMHKGHGFTNLLLEINNIENRVDGNATPGARVLDITMYKLLNCNCSILAIWLSELDVFRQEFNLGRHFPNLKHLIIIARLLNDSKHGQGKLVLEDEVPSAILPLAQ